MRQWHLVAHSQSNVLIITDRMSNINRLINIIQKVDEPSGNEIEVIPLVHASAKETVRLLSSLQRKNRKRKARKKAPILVADQRTNSILMSGNKSRRLPLKTLIAHLDTPSEIVGNTHVVHLRYAKAKDLVIVLSGVGKIKTKSRQKGRRASARGNNKSFDIQADESSNTLVITTTPNIFRSLQGVIQKLDVRRAQVLIETIIAEISANKTDELGVQWFVDGSKSGLAPVGATSFGSPSLGDVGSAIIQTNVTGTPPGNASALIGTGLSLGFGRFNSETFNFGGLLRALSGTSSVNLLSTPNLVTMDNHEAEIFVGREVSVPTGSFTQTSASSNNPFTTFTSKQVGIQLKVKPQISQGDSIKLAIEQTVDAITAGDAGTANLVTSQRTIKTTVMVENGQTIVLGGLIADDETNTIQKVPFLGDIPIIGTLFRYKRKIKDKKNLMLFLRPTIQRNSATLADISRSKYSLMLEQQIQAREDPREVVEKNLAPIMPKISKSMLMQ